MNHHLNSLDKTEIHYEISGKGRTALLFVHGWMGNSRWWDSQRDYFSAKYLIVQMDLAGHGKSEKTRKDWSIRAYAEDIKAVADSLDVDKIVLVGHSMSGSNVVEAFPLIKKAVAIVLVDTLKNLDQIMPAEQTKQFFDMYRQDFKGSVEKVLPQYLFAKTSPPKIVSRLLGEFVQNSPELVIATLEPFYKTDIRNAARRVTIPVRGINSDMTPTDAVVSKKYFNDFDFMTISGVGHYPMLEKPEEFNDLLEKTLTQLDI